MARRKASKGPTKDAIRPQIKLCALQLRITEVCDRKTIVQLRMDALVQRCLSVGTTTKAYSVSFGAGRDFGIADWMEDQRLFAVTISSQQQFVDQLVAHKLGDRYFRLDHEPSQEQSRDLGLDVASAAARKTLIGLADKATSDVIGTHLAPYLVHVPQLKLVRET